MEEGKNLASHYSSCWSQSHRGTQMEGGQEENGVKHVGKRREKRTTYTPNPYRTEASVCPVFDLLAVQVSLKTFSPPQYEVITGRKSAQDHPTSETELLVLFLPSPAADGAHRPPCSPPQPTQKILQHWRVHSLCAYRH